MPEVKNYSVRDYKGGGQVWTIAQDPRGIVYFGDSSSALLEFDGAIWRKIFLPSSVVRSLAVDDGGRVWLGASGNFGYLVPDANGARQYVSLLEKVPAQDRGFTDVWQTLLTPQGTFFRSYELLFRWDGKRMQVWSPEARSRFQALSYIRGRIYTAQTGIGLQEIVGDELRNLPGGEAYRSSGKLFLYPYDESRILVSARDQLFTLYDGQKVTPFVTQADDYLRAHRLYTSTVLRDGTICATTLTGGAVLIEHDGKLRQIIDKNDGILGSDVLSAYQDREGALWLGLDTGIARVEVNSPISIFSRETTLDVAEFNGYVYRTTAAGRSGLLRIIPDPQTGRPVDMPIAGPTQAWTLVVFKDPAGKAPDQLLVATSEGVMRLEGDALVPAIPGLHGFPEQVYDISVSRKDPYRVFIGHSDGVASTRWNGHSWIDEGRVPNLVYTARSVVEDAKGTLWASGGDNQIVRIDVAPSGMRDSKGEMLGTREGLPEGPAFANFVAGGIFATVDRVKQEFRWDEAAHTFVVDNRFLLPIDGPDAAFSLFGDGDDKVWSSSASSEIRRQGLFTRQQDGGWHLEEDTYRRMGRFRFFFLHPKPDATVWFFGENLVRFDPRIREITPQQFPTVVRQVKAGSQLIYGGDRTGDGSEKRLQPGSNALHFQFAALTYGNPAETVYQYFLEGLDKDWSAWTTQKEANYSGLGPGSYRFHARSRADDGRMGEEAVYAFTILPPWYRTKLAYVVYGLLFLLITFAFWRFVVVYERKNALRRTQELQTQAKALEATVNERTREIRGQASEIAAQRDSIELLSEIGREITASLDLNTILFKLYERVNQIVDASIFGVGLYRPEKNLIEYTLAIENGKRYAPYTRSMDDKNQLAVWCIEHREPILLNDVASESSKYIAAYKHTGGALEDGSMAQPPASMIYLPLIAQERVLGVLSIQSFKKNSYTEQHLSLLENLAAYTTIALDNANAYLVINEREHQVRERAAELVTINRITQALAAQLDRDSLIQLVGDQVRDLFHAPIAYVSLLDRATMMLHFPYAFGEDAPARPFGTGLTSQIIRTGQPLLINEDMDRKRAALGIEQIGRAIASFLGVPIPSGGQTIGVISVQSTHQEGRFTEADQRLLSTIASAVGVAFLNAKLFEEARQAREAPKRPMPQRVLFCPRLAMSCAPRSPLCLASLKLFAAGWKSVFSR